MFFNEKTLDDWIWGKHSVFAALKVKDQSIGFGALQKFPLRKILPFIK